MNFVLSILTGLALVVLKTGCLGHYFVPLRYFDLLLPLLIYLSVFRPITESILLMVIFGLVMDSLSGAPFGLYIVVYIWIFIGVRGGMHFLDAGSYYIFPLFLALGTIIEQAWFELVTSVISMRYIIIQVGLALVTAPFFLFLFNTLFDSCRKLYGYFRRAPQE